MAKLSPQGELFSAEIPGNDVAILSSRCRPLREGEQTVVVVCGAPVARFKETDRLAKANVMVMLVEHGWATQVEVARAFACDVRGSVSEPHPDVARDALPSGLDAHT